MHEWNGRIKVEMPRRRAEVSQSTHQAAYNKLEEGVHPCHVLGLYQCAEDEDDIQPYFVCELHDGRCIYADPKQVRFVDTDENGNIIDEEDTEQCHE